MKKTLVLLSGIILFTSIAHGFSGFFETQKTQSIELLRNLNPRIIPGNSSLASTVIVLRSKKDIEISSIKSPCPNTQKILYTNSANETSNIAVIELHFPSGSCLNESLRIGVTGAESDTTTVNLGFIDTEKRYGALLDYSTANLDDIVEKNLSKIEKITADLAPLKDSNSIVDKLKNIELAYSKLSITEETDTIQDILTKRASGSYLIPVPGKSMPTRPSKLPNAGRPFRADTTDGIHHGWDIDAPIGTPVRAMSDGVIVRILSDFSWADFSKIIQGKNLSYTTKTLNLDVLRGNQVWLKMADGNIVFYSHLKKVNDSLYLGKKVKMGDNLGIVGISGVPDKEYNDSHLHIEIAENPHDGKSYSNTDVLFWPYLGK